MGTTKLILLDSLLQEMEVTDAQKLGVGLGSFGLFFLMLGVLLLFDKGLLAIGNLFCLSGLVCVMGWDKSKAFFMNTERKLACLAFFSGIGVLLLGYPIIGMIIEMYGAVKLFGGFFNLAISFLRQVPVIGLLLALPGVSELCDTIGGNQAQS